MPVLRSYSVAGAIALITLIVFLPALGNGFVNWDDEQYVLDNIHIRSIDFSFFSWAFFTFYASNWHPLTWVSHAIDYRIWGLEPAGHHLTAIILHALNALLVTLLVIRLLKASMEERETGRIMIAAGVTGLLFGLHPVHVESVVWVSERKDVLCAFFYLLSILYYTGYATRVPDRVQSFYSTVTDSRYAASLCLFLLSLMSKPMAVSLPLVLLILDWFPLRRWEKAENRLSLLWEKIPFIVLSVVSSVVTILAQKSGGALIPLPVIPLFTKIANSIIALATYMVKLVMPLRLAPFNPYPRDIPFLSPAFVLSLLLVLGILFSALFLFRKRPVWTAAWTYFLVTLIPVLGIVQVGEQSLAYRYVYIPGIGPILLIGLAAAAVYDRLSAVQPIRMAGKILFFILPLAVFVTLSFMTVQQIHVWRDSFSLWSRQIALEPLHAKGYHFRGNASRVLGRYDAAAKDFTSAITLDPFSKPDLYNDRGIALAQLGLFREALSDFSAAIMMNPAVAVYYRNRGNVYRELGDGERAIGDFQKAESIMRSSGSRI